MSKSPYIVFCDPSPKNQYNINILLECWLWAVGFRPLIKQINFYQPWLRVAQKKKKKELLPVMTACRNTFHNGAMTYMLHIHESTIHKILVACVVLTEAMLHTLISNLMNAIWLCWIYYSRFLNCMKYLYWGSSGWSFSDWNGVIFGKIHPGSIPDWYHRKIIEWLAGFRKKNIKILSSTIFLVLTNFFKKAYVRKIIQFSEAEVAAKFDITPASTHVQRFTVHVYDWRIINDQPIQKIDSLTPVLGNLCNVAKYLTHTVPTCKRVKLMVKVWFFVLIYKTFEAFTLTIIYTLFEVTTTRLKFLQQFLFLKFIRVWKNW